MRVLVSAYACEPSRGSEPEAGLQMVLAAATRHDVWVITRENNLPSLQAFLDHHPLGDRIHSLGLDVDGLPRRIKKRTGLLGMHWYYDLWQRRLAEFATRLDRELDFDVTHHATFAAYWTRAGVAEVGKPLVWGPVGGGVESPLGLLPVLGFRGIAGDAYREVARPVMFWVTRARRTARRARVVLVQNPETAHRLRLDHPATVLPNALCAADAVIPTGESNSIGDPRVVTAARLVGWKGTTLAIACLKHIRHPRVTLDVYGAGPQRDRLLRLSRRLGLSERVRLRGTVPRDDLLSALEQASVLLHPALHEEAGFVIAEALALGTPVVSLDRGGPPIIMASFPDVPSRAVTPSRPGETAQRLAAAVDDLVGSEVRSPLPRRDHFVPLLLDAYERAVGTHPNR
jgi:glycosyltransferase involved in cell wall biosynthesis